MATTYIDNGALGIVSGPADTLSGGSLAGTMEKPPVSVTSTPASYSNGPVPTKLNFGITPTVVTSNNARTETQGNIQQLSNIEKTSGTKPTTNANGQVIDPTTGAVKTFTQADGTITDSLGAVISSPKTDTKSSTDKAIESLAPYTGAAYRVGNLIYRADNNQPLSADESNEYVKNYAGGSIDNLPSTLPIAPTPSKTEAQIGLDDSMKKMQGFYDAAEANTKALIDSITKEYEGYIKQQEVQNKAYEGGVTREGLVSGRSRYAPIIESGIVQAAVSQGISKLADLVNKKNSLILQAQNARDEKQYQILGNIMTQYRQTVKDEKEASRQVKEDYYKAQEEARASAKADREAATYTLDNSAAAVAKTVVGMSPEEADAYYTSVAKKIGTDPLSLKNAVIAYGQKTEQATQGTILDLASKYPDAGITNTDVSGGDIFSVMNKVTQSASYARATALERAKIDAELASAAKSRASISQDSNLSAIQAYAETWATTGNKPTGIPAHLIGPAQAYAKEVAKDLPTGTMIDAKTGFALPSGRIPATMAEKAGFTVQAMSALERMRSLIESKSFTVGPGGRFISNAGKLSNLTSAERTEFEGLRDMLVASLVQSISGVAVNEAEYKRLTKLVPNSDEWQKYTLTKFDSLLDSVKSVTKARTGLYGATIKDVNLQPTWEIEKESKLGSEFDN